MDQLVNLVKQKAGISDEQARTAVNVVLSFLKDHLPAPIAKQLDTAASGNNVGDDVMKGLGGMLGK